MLSFNFFDSNEWEFISNDTKDDTIRQQANTIAKLEEEIKGYEYVFERHSDDIYALTRTELEAKARHQRQAIKGYERKVRKLEKELKTDTDLIKTLQTSNASLSNKNAELEQNIRSSEDLPWKEKYDALVISNKMVVSELQMWRNKARRNRDGYIFELEDKVKGLEAANEKLLAKIANQSKEITHLLKNQKKLKAEIANDEKTIFAHQTNNAMLLKKIGELTEGIRNFDDLTWKEKYDELYTRYKGNNEQNDETCKKLLADINHISERCRRAEDKVKGLEAEIEGYEIKVRKLEKELKTEQTRNVSLSNKIQKHRQVLFEIDDLIKKNGYRKV